MHCLCLCRGLHAVLQSSFPHFLTHSPFLSIPFIHSLTHVPPHPPTHPLTHPRPTPTACLPVHTAHTPSLFHCHPHAPHHTQHPTQLSHIPTHSPSPSHTLTHTHTVTVTSLTDCAHSLTHSLTHCDYLHLDNNLFVCCCYRDTTQHTTHEVGWCTNTTRLHVLRLVGRMVGRTGGRQMTTRRNNMALQNSVVWLSYGYLVGKQGLALWHREPTALSGRSKTTTLCGVSNILSGVCAAAHKLRRIDMVVRPNKRSVAFIYCTKVSVVNFLRLDFAFAVVQTPTESASLKSGTRHKRNDVDRDENAVILVG